MRWLVVILALGGVGLFFLQTAYGTMRPCEALQVAIAEDAPDILARAGRSQRELAALNLGRSVFDRGNQATRGIAARVAGEAVSDMNALECGGLIAWREFDRSDFQARIAARLVRAIN